MIHNAINAVLEAVEERFGAEVKECRYYKGEFEEGSQWNPVFPIVLANCTALTPEQTSQKGWIARKAALGVYVGLQLDDEDQQQFFTEFIEWLTTLFLEGYELEVQAVNLLGYFNGIEAYKFDLTVVQR
ncbi:MAG: hypothetical protein H3C35_08520 [Bacteroidetes bacterium]|nr:hypothetical protein [Bacteroidota bacterium]